MDPLSKYNLQTIPWGSNSKFNTIILLMISSAVDDTFK